MAVSVSAKNVVEETYHRSVLPVEKMSEELAGHSSLKKLTVGDKKSNRILKLR